MARQRRTEILLAMAGVVARDGLDAATLTNVAVAAGLQRTLVLHYFRNRRELVDAFVAEAVATYGDRMLLRDGGEPLSTRLVRIFDPDAYTSRDDLAIWAELVAQAGRADTVRHLLRELWIQRWLPEIERQLAADHPEAEREDIARIAYALSCLAEGHWFLHLQGVTDGPDTTRRHQAQQAALALLATLQQ